MQFNNKETNCHTGQETKTNKTWQPRITILLTVQKAQALEQSNSYTIVGQREAKVLQPILLSVSSRGPKARKDTFSIH